MREVRLERGATGGCILASARRSNENFQRGGRILTVRTSTVDGPEMYLVVCDCGLGYSLISCEKISVGSVNIMASKTVSGTDGESPGLTSRGSIFSSLPESDAEDEELT